MKKNKFEFIIDPEFQSQIPALTKEEFRQLEENILSEGTVLSPLIVWGNILVDGHSRYQILRQHPEIPYTTRSIEQCFTLYPDFLTNVEIEAKVIASLQKAENYIAHLKEQHQQHLLEAANSQQKF